SVLKRKPLVRAIALALMAGTVAVPAGAWAATMIAGIAGTVAVPPPGLGANITGTAFYDLTGKRTCTIPVESRIVYYRVNGGSPSYVRTDQTGKYQISTSTSPVEITIDTPSEEVLTSPALGRFNVSGIATNLDFVFSVPDFQNTAPAVKLGGTIPTSVNVNTSVSFTATFSDSDGNGLCATNPPKWDFGDSTTANGLTASHTYAKAGTYTATLTVTDEYGAQDKAQTTITVTEPAKPQMQISTSKVDFGQSIVGTRGYQSVTVSNTGNAPLQVGKVQMAGNTSDFGVPSDSCSNKTLAPSSQCTMQVYSQPTVAGQRGATVTVPSNSSSSPTGYVTLAASGMVLKATNGSSDCTATATIDSMPTGIYYPDSSNPPNWIKKGTTDSVALPSDYTASVFIPDATSVTISANTVLKLKNLCNRGTLQGKADTGGGVKIYTDGFITNYGIINGGGAGLVCKSGGDVVLVSTKSENLSSYGKAGDTWWSSNVGGNPIENYGQIQGGDGGKCTSPATAKGGNAIVLGRNVTNGNTDSPNAEIKGGKGKTGDGGLTQVWGKLGGAGVLRSQGSIQGGDGTGKGGNLWLVSLPSVFLGGVNNYNDRTKHHAGCGGGKAYDSTVLKCTGATGVDGWVRIEPNSISITGTDISGGDVVIYGGNDWTLDLHNLNGVITSTGDIILAVGQGGVVDLTENTQPVLKADGKVTIYADTIILNEGVKLEDVIQATQIVKQPSKILRSVSLTGANTVVGKAGETISLLMKLANNSPEGDTFTLTVSNPGNWQLTQLPAQIELPQLEVIELPLEVTLPSTPGVSSEITVTATSQADPTVKTTMTVQAVVATEEQTTHTLFGTLKDKYGNPLTGVTVQLGDQTVTTDNTGHWEITGVATGNYTLTATKDNFVFQPKPIDLTSQTTDKLEIKVAIDKEPYDVWIADPAPDDGSEPSKTTWIWASPDVWVRNQDDNGMAYQNVMYGQDNYVYVRIRNKGTLPAQNTKVEVYRSGASMGQSWPRGWQLVGTANVAELNPGATDIVHIKWDKDRIANPGHYCFYARLLNDQDPMFVAETNDMVGNTVKNNNIAWRNFNVVGLLTQVTDKFKVAIGNPTNTKVAVNLVFDEREQLLQNDGAKAIVDLGATLFQRWQAAGGQGENVQVLNGTEVQLLATPAKLIGIPLEVGEELPLTMRVDAFQPAPGAGTSREYHFSTQELINGELVGGVDYAITTRAQDTDSDGDGIKDVVDNDNDNDGIADEWEIQYGLNPLGNTDAAEDSDGDGLSNLEEYQVGTNPVDSTDAAEDSDGDGVSNLEEYQKGTDPLDPASKPPIVEVKYTASGKVFAEVKPLLMPLGKVTVQIDGKT
ncbi:MAG: hypothetical protein BWK78_06555, partial [Thiotrichaceae bacterium IS1]